MVTGEVTGSTVTPSPKQKQSDDFKWAQPSSEDTGQLFCKAFFLTFAWLSRASITE